MDRHDPEEDRLASFARDGCADSFDRLARRVRPRLVRVLARQTGDAHLAEDLAQDALLRAQAKLHLYNPARPFGPWLFTVALRVGRSHQRKRRPVTQPLDLPGATSAWIDPAPGPADTASTRDQAQRLWRCAEQTLTPDAFAALWLVYGEGLTPKQTARALGRSAGATRVLLHRARKRLAERLAQPDPPDTNANPIDTTPGTCPHPPQTQTQPQAKAKASTNTNRASTHLPFGVTP
ncbi:MAG: sigma-70 family RNA polymerase sigma factor [Planctomycetota bacterium]